MSAPRSYGWRIATVSGIPVYLGRSWPLIAVVIVAMFGPLIEHPTDPVASPAYGYLVAVGYALVLLLSVLAHEGAHAAVARAVGCRVDRVVADLWGGHTVYESGVTGPGTSATIAVSGPLANAALAALGYGAAQVVSDPTARVIIGALTVSNLFVAVFNMLPGLPLDGGYLVESAVWRITGDRNRGMVFAGHLGRLVTVAVVAWLVVDIARSGSTPSIVTMIWILLIAGFLWRGATNAIAVGRTRLRLETIRVRDVLHPVVTLTLDASAAAVAGALLTVAAANPLVVAVDAAGRPVGAVDPRAYAAIPQERRPVVPVSSLILAPAPGWVVTSDPDDTVTDIVVSIQSSRADVVLVQDRAGRLLGYVTVDEIATRMSSARV